MTRRQAHRAGTVERWKILTRLGTEKKLGLPGCGCVKQVHEPTTVTPNGLWGGDGM